MSNNQQKKCKYCQEEFNTIEDKNIHEEECCENPDNKLIDFDFNELENE